MEIRQLDTFRLSLKVIMTKGDLEFIEEIELIFISSSSNSSSSSGRSSSNNNNNSGSNSSNNSSSRSQEFQSYCLQANTLWYYSYIRTFPASVIVSYKFNWKCTELYGTKPNA